MEQTDREIAYLLAQASKAIIAVEEAMHSALLDLPEGPAHAFEQIAVRACGGALVRLDRASRFHSKARQFLNDETYRDDI